MTSLIHFLRCLTTIHLFSLPFHFLIKPRLINSVTRFCLLPFKIPCSSIKNFAFYYLLLKKKEKGESILWLRRDGRKNVLLNCRAAKPLIRCEIFPKLPFLASPVFFVCGIARRKMIIKSQLARKIITRNLCVDNFLWFNAHFLLTTRKLPLWSFVLFFGAH